jgi:hypothetical protein
LVDFAPFFIHQIQNKKMKLETAKRQQVKIKVGLQGCAGSGKSYSALLMAYGLVGNWNKIAVIDTENAAHLYSHLGNYQVLKLTAPHSPERFIEAINTCVDAGIEAVITDSLSMEWDYIIDAHSQLSGNSYTNWAKFTPRHQRLIQAILQADVHIICNLRSKQDYVLNQKNGKSVPEKVGMKPIQREGVDYELTLVLELDIKHNAVASKDRTGLFMGKPEFTITTGTGKAILDWCNEGDEPVALEIDYNALIQHCGTVEALRTLYLESTDEIQSEYRNEFNQRKYQLQVPNLTQRQNGTTNSK